MVCRSSAQWQGKPGERFPPERTAFSGLEFSVLGFRVDGLGCGV